MLFEESNIHIGIDFDNTIVDYGNIFTEMAIFLGFIDYSVKLSKDEVKKIIKESDDGERKWGILQSEVYGKGIRKALMMEGFSDFVNRCRACAISLYIVSHKSISNPYDPMSRNLQIPALDWMKRQNFFKKGALGFNQKQVIFAETVDKKVEWIKKLNCSYFIDDLLKVLLHPRFPERTLKVQFLNESPEKNVSIVDYAGNWRSITNYVIP